MHIWYNFYIRNLKLHSKARLSNPKLKFAWASWSNVEWYVIQVSDGGSLIIYIDNDVDIATDVNDDNDFSGKPSNDDDPWSKGNEYFKDLLWRLPMYYL